MESDQAGGLTTSFTPPDMVAQSRAIVQSELRLSIVVNNSETIFAGEAIAESRGVTIPAARGEKLNIVVTWSERYRGQLLVLARAEESTTVPVDAQADYSFTIDTENYTTEAFDDDGDLISNLKERNNGTDPRVQNQDPNEVVTVTIKFRANIPERLADVNSDIDQALIAFAAIDTSPVELTREGNTWVGQVEKPANSDVLVNYSFYYSPRPNIKLATWEDRRNAGEGGTTVDIASNEYDYEIDIDGDGISNLQETIDGTNPDDKNDPALNPCDISIFEVNCNNDSDGDGTPDSVETESADQDEDSIPDYLESKNDDADDDGFNAELDRDETDPCIPDENAIACDDSDQIEPPEPSPLSYEYFNGQFSSMPDFSRLTPDSTGTSPTFSLPDSNGENFYALQFTGKLFIERADVYTFYTESDDGSILYIDGIRVVDNDGTHSLLEESGVIELSAGLHDIVVAYFQNDGSEALSASWSSSTLAKETIPETVLFAPQIAP